MSETRNETHITIAKNHLRESEQKNMSVEYRSLNALQAIAHLLLAKWEI